MTVLAAFIINNVGEPRLVRVYSEQFSQQEKQLVTTLHVALTSRGYQTPGVGTGAKGDGATKEKCNFVEGAFGEGVVCVFRTFATLHFALLVDEGESLLDMLDLIGNVVATLDLLFPAVCELDLVFNYPLVNSVFDEWIVGGLVVDTTPRAAAEDVRQLDALCLEASAFTKAATAFVTEIKEKLTPTREFKKI